MPNFVSRSDQQAFKVGRYLVEIVDDDTDEEIHDQVRANEHEQHEEPDDHYVLVPDRLHVHVSCVHGRVHNRCPSLGGGNLEEREQSLSDVVELLRNGLVPIQPEALAHLLEWSGSINNGGDICFG